MNAVTYGPTGVRDGVSCSGHSSQSEERSDRESKITQWGEMSGATVAIDSQ